MRAKAAVLILTLILPITSLASHSPETFILPLPSTAVGRSDLVIWWSGEAFDGARLIGFYYSVDGGEFEFTKENHIALFDLAEGEHIVRVKAMDSNLVEDPTPAELIFSVSPRKVGEPEPNDSPDLAVQLPLGVEMFGVTASWKEDPDWFEITLPQNATALTVTFKRPGGDGSTEVAVLSETGETLTAFRAEPSTGQKGYATLGVRPGSKVYVKVSPSNVTRGFAYILTADYIPSSSSGIWEVEGGTAEVKLSGGKLILMGLKDLDSDDEDLIRLRADVRSPKLLSIKLSRLKTASPAEIEVFKGELFEDTSKVSILPISPLSGGCGSTEFLISFGDYHIRVPNAGEEVGSGYQIVLSLNDPPPGAAYELEPNGISPRESPEYASPFEPELGIYGSSWGDGDVDWLSFELSESGLLLIPFRRLGGVGRTKVELFNADLIPLASAEADPTTSQRCTIALSDARPGLYYVKLTPSDERPNSTYRLNALLVKGISHNARRPLRLGELFEVEVRWRPGGGVRLTIEGDFPDEEVRTRFEDIPLQEVSPGLYKLSYRLREGDWVENGRMILSFETAQGDEARFEHPDAITFEAGRAIESAEHDADRRLGIGDVLTVTLISSIADGKASFDLPGVAEGVPLYGDGTGRYVGSYRVKEGDLLDGGLITVKIADRFGNEYSAEIDKPVHLDGVRPSPPSSLTAEDVPNDNGLHIRLSWKPSPDTDISSYNVYVSQSPITSLEGLSPALSVAGTSCDVRVERNGVDYYFAVTAVDLAGNESGLDLSEGGSTAGPVSAVDNLPPEIRSASHDAAGIISTLNPRITVRVESEPGIEALLTIEGIAEDIPMSGEEGVYTATYELPQGIEREGVEVTVRLRDEAGNERVVTVGPPISVDTRRPTISGVRVEGKELLAEGDELRVEVRGEAGCEGWFDIEGLREGLPLQEVESGIYRGSYRIGPDDKVLNAQLTCYLKDKAGNISSSAAPRKVDIDATPPQIRSTSVQPQGVLKAGDELAVLVETEIGCKAYFSVEGLIEAVPLFDDGKHGDGEAGDGVYRGVYRVEEGDEAKGAAVRVRVEKRNGKSVEMEIGKVWIDGSPPPPVEGVVVEDVPADEGYRLRVRWGGVDVPDLKGYLIFVSEEEIGSVEGLEPVLETRGTEATIEVEENGRAYWVAVAAEDEAGNLSPLTSGSLAKGMAIDNTPPAGVSDLRVWDTPFDCGGRISVSWSYGLIPPDWDRFRIYLSTDPQLKSAQTAEFDAPEIKAVDLPVQDGIDYYIGISCLDENGNESTIAKAGPVKAEPQYEPDERLISIPTGIIRGNSVLLRWRTDKFAYQLDGIRYESDQPLILIKNLSPGEHEINLEMENGQILSRKFLIDPMPLKPDGKLVPPNLTASGTGRLFVRIDETSTLNIIGEEIELSTPQGILMEGQGFITLSPGIYSIKWNGDLTLYTTPKGDDLEPENDEGVPIQTERLISGRIQREGDVDVYEFELNTPGRVGISLRRFGQVDLKLERSGGEEVRGEKTDVNGYLCYLSEPLPPGGYRAVLSGERGSDYDLAVMWLGDMLVEARELMREGDSIRVELPAVEGRAAFMEVEGLFDRRELSEREGRLAGEYVVRKGDELAEGRLKLIFKLNGEEMPFWVPGVKIGVDTSPPAVYEARHDAERPLGVGSKLKVTLRGEAGCEAWFEISGVVRKVDLDEVQPGLYEGEYEVREGDEAEEAEVICHLRDAAGNEAEVRARGGSEAYDRVVIDTTPPSIDEVRHSGRGVLVEGDVLEVEVRGEAGCEGWFDIEGLREGLPLQEVESGLYRGSYQVKPGDLAVGVRVVAHLRDEAGNETAVESAEALTIDTLPPEIKRVEHNADRILRKGDLLIVRVEGTPGCDARFGIEGVAEGLPLYDDGRHDDGASDDGIYVGSYAVKEGDDVEGASLTVKLRKANGKSSEKAAALRVSIDTIPPDPVRGVTAHDKPDDEGYVLILSWEPSHAPDFSLYRIYRSPTPILSTAGMRPIMEIGAAEATEIEVEVPETGADYYFAVTALDRAGNESDLDLSEGGSTFGPVKAIDNLPPPPVRGAWAADRPNDFGGVALVGWAGPSPAEDFDHYNVYVSTEPISSIEGLRPIVVRERGRTVLEVETADGVDYYFAVTAVDRSGNESTLASDSVAGPVRSKPDLPQVGGAAIRFVYAPFGQLFSDMISVCPSRWAQVGPNAFRPTPGYLWSLDGSPYVLSLENVIDLFGLSDGEHVLSLKPADMPDSPPTSIRFSVLSSPVPESEPNDAPELAQPIAPGLPVVGNNPDDTDVDWFSVQVDRPGAMSVLFAREKGIGETRISIFREGVQEAIARLRVDPSARNRGGVTVGVSPGRYLISLSPRSENPSAEYRLLIAVHELGDGYAWEVEPNGAALSATEIAFEGEVELNGECGEGDVDWFAFDQTVEGEMLKAEIVRSGEAELKAELFLGDPTGTGATVDRTTVQPRSLSAAGWVGLRSGRYYLKLECPKRAAYSVRLVRFKPEGPVEFEPNDRAELASELPIGSTLLGRSYGDDDLDLYSLRVTERRIVAVGFSRPDGIGSTAVELISPAGDVIASSTADPSTGEEAYLTAELSPGRYIVSVKSQGERPGSDYRLSAVALESLSHDAAKPLGIGGTITLRVRCDPGLRPTFTIPGIIWDVEMREEGGGSFVGSYTVKEGDNLVRGLPYVTLTLPDGGRVRAFVEPEVTIDTSPPLISEVRHNAEKPLGVNAELRVWLKGEPGCRAYFELRGDGLERRVEMFDDGAHEDGAPNDGLYGGVYLVSPGDNAEAGVIGYLEDEAGNLSWKEAFSKVELDTSPPGITSWSISLVLDGKPYPIDLAPKKALGRGDRLEVRVETEPGAEVELEIEGFTSLKLRDDGVGGDEAAGDGRYFGAYTAREGDQVENAALKIKAIDAAGNSEEVFLPFAISIDAVPPQIVEVTHNGDRPLKKGDLLIVILRGEPGNRASFNIGGRRDERGELIRYPMADDGTGMDEKAGDGIYTGVYEVRAEDDLRDAPVIGFLMDENGNESVKFASKPLTLDSKPPSPIEGVTAQDKPGDEGYVVVLSWKPCREEDFDHYNIYRETHRITITKGLIPVMSDLTLPEMTTVEVPVPANNVDYYFAVTAVDRAGNESLVREGSWAGPVRALDNIKPEPVVKVSAEDRPDDQGGVIVVMWDTPSTAEDFDHYNIYVSREPISSIEGLEPIAQVTEREAYSAEVRVETNVDYFVAVTAVDRNGNESDLDPLGNSTFGPVRAIDDIPPEPVEGVYAVDTPSDDGGSVTVFWRRSGDESVIEYRIYISEAPIASKADLSDAEMTPVPAEGIGEEMSFQAAVPTGVPIYLAVTAVDLGGHESELGDESVWGPVYAVSNRISAEERTIVYAGFDPRIKVEIPPGSGEAGRTVDILVPTDPEVLDLISRANRLSSLEVSLIDPDYEEFLGETVVQVEYGGRLIKPALITLSYPEFTDDPSVEGKVRIFRLNEEAGVWELLPGVQRVDPDRNTVSAYTDKLSLFRVAVLELPGTVDKVVAYPNPYIRGRSRSGGIHFVKLPERATILIYTLDGKLVRRIETEPGMGRAFWDLKNEAGREVDSGLYIYVVKCETGIKRGRLVVIR